MEEVEEDREGRDRRGVASFREESNMGGGGSQAMWE